MKIIVSPDSFKGSLTAAEAAKAMARGVRKVFPEAEIVLLPVGDGGEGTLEALSLAYFDRESAACRTLNPLGREITAKYLIVSSGEKKTALIEMAAASGLTLVAPEERDILSSDTYGTGILIADAYRRGIRDFIICLGGSATCDGGYGAYRALTSLHYELGFPEVGPLLPDARFTLLCDVRNPLCGDNGAARVFGPQKGASENDIELLEQRNAGLAIQYRRHRNIDVTSLPYAGAAGGLGGMLMACLNSRATDGIETVLDIIGFDSFADKADLIITGEGCLDRTSLEGKAPLGILRRAMKYGVPAIAIGGKVRDREMLMEAGFAALEQATPEERLATICGDKEACRHYVEEATSRILDPIQ